jgi:hypothetical protein
MELKEDPLASIAKTEGVVRVAETNSLLWLAENTDGSSVSEVELDVEFWKLQKKRLVKVRKHPGRRDSWAVNLTVPFKIFRDERESVNGAEVFLLPEELSVFTRTLIEYPIPLPTTYSQQLAMERGMYCMRMKSEEPFKDFAERLSKALRVLG